MVMAVRSVHIQVTTLFFLGKLEQAVNQYFMHILSFVTDNNPSWMIQSEGENMSAHVLLNLSNELGKRQMRDLQIILLLFLQQV